MEKNLERIANALEAILIVLQNISNKLDGKPGAPTPAAQTTSEAEDDFLGGGTPAPPLTADAVIEKARECANANGKESVKAVLKKFKVEKVTDLKSDDYAKFVDALAKVKKA